MVGSAPDVPGLAEDGAKRQEATITKRINNLLKGRYNVEIVEP